MIAVLNLGCVGSVVKTCIVLQLCRLVVNCLLSRGGLVAFSGVVA